MHGISNKANPYDIIAANAEKEHKTLVALYANSWHLPIYKQTIEYSLSTLRKAMVIEEYIMKAASMNLSYPVNVSMLPELLGLDEIFLEDAIKSLIEKKILDKTAIPALRLTEAGESHLSRGTVFDKEQVESIEYYIDRKSATVYASPKEVPEIGIHPKYEFLDKNIENAKKYINHKFLIDAGKTLGKELENPGMGTKISSVISAKTTDAVKTLFTEITCFDIAENKLIRKVWDHAGKRFRTDLEKILDGYNIDSGYKAELKNAVGIAADIQELFRKKEPGIKICRGKEKNDLTINLINSAKEQLTVCIPSPASEDIESILKIKNSADIKFIYKNAKDDITGGINVLKDAGIEVVQSDSCDSAEIIADNTVIISGINWASCHGDFVTIDEATYVISDEEFVSKRKMM